jgi:hypothetical protein
MSSIAISRTDPSNSPYAVHRATGVTRVRTHTESTKSSLALNVITAEGDTVELSYDATSLKQTEKATARSSPGKATSSNTSESSSYNFNAKVTGDLNEQELSDIANVIKALQTGVSPTASLSSLTAYSGAYQQTTAVTNSSLRLYA